MSSTRAIVTYLFVDLILRFLEMPLAISLEFSRVTSVEVRRTPHLAASGARWLCERCRPERATIPPIGPASPNRCHGSWFADRPIKEAGNCGRNSAQYLSKEAAAKCLRFKPENSGQPA
jgi:hypothetical protein